MSCCERLLDGEKVAGAEGGGGVAPGGRAKEETLGGFLEIVVNRERKPCMDAKRCWRRERGIMEVIALERF